ncbi:MAG: hypothetical protein COB49_06375 [Alphaproteobacteria bacterium]|nr:MAG: hypothetical protein COB49_06375 [Alphaproteobacteria bacterium]
MIINKFENGTGGLFGQSSLNRTEQDSMHPQSIKYKEEEIVISRKTSHEDNISVSDIWQRLARNIDVRSASPREIIALSSQLYNAGVISYDDHINLSFQPEVNLDTPSQSKPFSFERKDYIALWKNKQENVIRFGGDRNEIEETHRIQAILTYVDSLR